MRFFPPLRTHIFSDAVAYVYRNYIFISSKFGRLNISIDRHNISLSLSTVSEVPIDLHVLSPVKQILSIIASLITSLVDGEEFGRSITIGVVGPPLSGKSTFISRLTRNATEVYIAGVKAQLTEGQPGDCTVVLAPLDMFHEIASPDGKRVLVCTRPPDRGLCSVYTEIVKPIATYVLDVFAVEEWELAEPVFTCLSS